MAYMDSGWKNSLSFTTDAYKKQTYPKVHPDPKRPQNCNHPQQLPADNLPTKNVENTNVTN